VTDIAQATNRIAYRTKTYEGLSDPLLRRWQGFGRVSLLGASSGNPGVVFSAILAQPRVAATLDC
jgi:hypothetical protein